MSFNYIGSKKSLVSWIETSLNKYLKKFELEIEDGVMGDLFAGTGVIGRYFSKDYKIISNDMMYYSFVINSFYLMKLSEKECKIYNKEIKKHINILNELIDNINEDDIKEDNDKYFIYKNYTIDRKYFSPKNGLRIDMVRQYIEDKFEKDKILKVTYYGLIVSLLLGISKVANTCSVYGAYLKKLKKSAKKKLILEIPQRGDIQFNNIILNDKVENIQNYKYDVVYIDPPYNGRQYVSNYHILETIAKYDYPTIHGKTGLRDGSNQQSAFCSSRLVYEAFENLINKLDTSIIMISYNSDGLMSKKDIKEILKTKFNNIKIYKKEYKKFKSGKKIKKSKVIEYLFIGSNVQN